MLALTHQTGTPGAFLEVRGGDRYIFATPTGVQGVLNLPTLVNVSQSANIKPMATSADSNFVSRDELNARLETVEARMLAHVGEIKADVRHIQSDVGEMRTDIREMRQEITRIRTIDFRLLFAAIITVTLGLAALMAKGFHWI